MNRLFRFLASVRLALVLLALIIVLSIVATLIPQHRDEEYYRSTYSPTLAGIVVTLHLHRFYRSAGFLVPVACFFVNLLSCSLRRIVARARRGAKPRFGPDVVHLATLLLIVVGVVSIFVIRSAEVVLAPGESFVLPGGHEVRADDLRQINYEDGRPKDWYSSVSVLNTADEVVRTAVIEVNRPLQIGAYKVYQYSFSNDGEIIVSDSTARGAVVAGDRFSLGDRIIGVRSTESTMDGETEVRSAVFETIEEGERITFRLEEGESRFGLTVEEITFSPRTGLLIRYNPLFPFILTLLFAFIGGLSLTFIQKLRDGAAS